MEIDVAMYTKRSTHDLELGINFIDGATKIHESSTGRWKDERLLHYVQCMHVWSSYTAIMSINLQAYHFFEFLAILLSFAEIVEISTRENMSP